MVEQLLNSLLFYFFSAEFQCREKVRDPPNYLRSVICWDLFLYFWGHFGVTNGRTVGLRYTAPKLSAISYLFGTFSLLIMGDTERPRYTGFRGLSVRGITALQCISLSSCEFNVFILEWMETSTRLLCVVYPNVLKYWDT